MQDVQTPQNHTYARAYPGGIANRPTVAYFSMEVALEPAIPTYSGGLGVLAGDTLRGAADLHVPMVGVTLLHRKGYFKQRLDENGNQTEAPVEWSPEDYLEPLDARTTVTIEGRTVTVRAWRYKVKGALGHVVPVFLLDTHLPENDPRDQSLTDCLYGGDNRYRLCQEVVLGIGGVGILKQLGYPDVQVYHMNEGHSSLLALALLEEQVNGGRRVGKAAREVVRGQCVFTTHTPVPAGHDQFPMELVAEVLSPHYLGLLEETGCCLNGTLNMTYLALAFSRYINGVAMRHGQVSRDMFPQYPISSITNGVHVPTWTSEPFGRLFDTHIREWRTGSMNLRHAIVLPTEAIRDAHAAAKGALLEEVRKRTGQELDPNAFTIGFARRATAYKRADLFFSDRERLKRIAREVGKIQVIYAGKAHPRDEMGKDIIRRVFEASRELREAFHVVYLEGYEWNLGRLLCSGVDLWLNTPQKPQEASGTSGMKAALNGVPSLSILDGWWVEGHFEGVTGWSIGDSCEGATDNAAEAASLYDKLEHVILPLYYGNPEGYLRVMRNCIAINGSFFNTERMVLQYLENAYRIPMLSEREVAAPVNA